MADDFENPNGLCFSPDEAFLYVNDSPKKHIRKFRVEADGTLSGGAVWAETTGEGAGLPDGMKTDSRENVYCCAQGGIHIFNKNADYLGIIKVPEQTGNCAFGGPDMDILYLAASTTLYSFRIKGRADKNGRKILNGQGK
ncbi:MAG: SMP-30/gluconolactonase/LRE family protein [Enterocloster sp.]